MELEDTTTPRFNALDDGWLPVRFSDGTVDEVGLHEALCRAQEIEALADPRPLGQPTQLRLLIALAQRIFQPEDAEDWRELWEAKRFDEAMLTDYFTRWRERFELFHPETPFLQIGGDFSMGNTNPIAKLAHDTDPAEYNTLFSHADGPIFPVRFGECIRYLLVCNCYARAGGRTGDPAWRSKVLLRPNYSDGSIGSGAVVIFEGRNLFQTILLNLVPAYIKDDTPVWEQHLTPAYFERTTASGPLDRLTNLSRMIRLIPEGNGGTVLRCYYTQGRALSEGATDTMVSYRKDERLGPQSRKVSESRASWRDLHGLLEFSRSEDQLRAGVLRFVGERVADRFLPKALPLRVVGIAADKAKVLLWRSDRFSVPTAFLENPDLVAELARLLEQAKAVEQEIGKRVRSMCWYYLAPVKDQMSPDTKDVNALADQLDARQGYWASLERHYPELLKRIGELPDTEPETTLRVTEWWQGHSAAAAHASVIASQKRLGETPRAWRALAAIVTNFENFDPKEKK